MNDDLAAALAAGGIVGAVALLFCWGRAEHDPWSGGGGTPPSEPPCPCGGGSGGHRSTIVLEQDVVVSTPYLNLTHCAPGSVPGGPGNRQCVPERPYAAPYLGLTICPPGSVPGGPGNRQCVPERHWSGGLG